MTDPHKPEPTKEAGTPSGAQQTEPQRRDTGSGFPWGVLLFLLVAVVVVIFSVQNTQDSSLRFLGWTWELPLVIIVLVTVVVSVFLDEILGAMLRSRRRRRRAEKEELRRLRQKR